MTLHINTDVASPIETVEYSELYNTDHSHTGMCGWPWHWLRRYSYNQILVRRAQAALTNTTRACMSQCAASFAGVFTLIPCHQRRRQWGMLPPARGLARHNKRFTIEEIIKIVVTRCQI